MLWRFIRRYESCRNDSFATLLFSIMFPNTIKTHRDNGIKKIMEKFLLLYCTFAYQEYYTKENGLSIDRDWDAGKTYLNTQALTNISKNIIMYR